MKQQAIIVLVAAAAIVVGASAWADSSAGVQEVRFDPSQVKEGKTVFNDVCSACHTNKPNQHKIGPSLFGVIGRHAGSAPGFDYSNAMKGAPVTWNDETLDRYLADPKSFVPGNKMPYTGVKNEERRKDIIAYLHTLQ
jgi:cytochrome c2